MIESYYTRREWLQRVGCTAVAWQAASVLGAEEPQTRKFRFVQLNDTHVQAPLRPSDPPRVTTYARANDKLTSCVETFNKTVKPDFVLAIGDLIHGETRERLPLDLTTFQELTKPLAAPIYPTLGNHEVVQQEGNPEYEKAYRDVFGNDRVSYSFEQSGIRFVMLNNSGAVSVGKEVIRKRNDWLRQTLAKHTSQPKIIGCHIPVVPIRQEPVLAKSFGFRSYQAHDPELLAIIESHAATTIAVLSGHLHLTGGVKRHGVHHISICGTASYPSDFAIFDVFDDRVEMTVQQLPAELAKSDPSIHGRPRFPQDFTDADHDTGEIYQAGRADERRLIIPIRG